MDKLSHNIIGYLEEWFDDNKNQIKKRRQQLLNEMFFNFNDGKLNKRYNNEIEKFLLSYSKDIKILFENEMNKIEEIKKSIQIKET